MEPILFELESVLGVDGQGGFIATFTLVDLNRCDLCGEEVAGHHNCPMPDPGDPFVQPISEWDEE